MEINKKGNQDNITLELSGRLDTSTAPQLQEVLNQELTSAKAVDLDFTDLAYVSSAGLRVLLTGEKTAKAKGIDLSLTNVSPEVMEVFEMTGFSDILKFK